MTITFSVQVEPDAWAISCACGDVNYVTSYASYDDARNAFDVGVRVSCGDDYCSADHCYIIPAFVGELPPEVNMSNVNAEYIIGLLGIEFDSCGSISGTDLMGRVLMAQAVSPSDAGIPVIQTGIVVDMGRAAGYGDERLLQMEDVARFSIDHNLLVVWS